MYATTAQAVNIFRCGFSLVFKGLTVKAPISTKVVSFSRLLKCFRSLSSKQRRLKSEQFDLGPLCLSLCLDLLNIFAKIAADDFSRRPFQMNFFAGVSRVKCQSKFQEVVWQDVAYVV